MGEPGFWDVQEEAKKVVDRLKGLRAALEPWTPYAARLEDAGVLFEMGVEANDEATLAECEPILAGLLADADRLETRALLSGPNDEAGAFLSVKAGAGGTESCDWAEMLLRMYIRWAEKSGYTVVEVDRQEGAGGRRPHRHGRGARPVRVRLAPPGGGRPPARPHQPLRRAEAAPDHVRRRRGPRRSWRRPPGSRSRRPTSRSARSARAARAAST